MCSRFATRLCAHTRIENKIVDCIIRIIQLHATPSSMVHLFTLIHNIPVFPDSLPVTLFFMALLAILSTNNSPKS